MAGPGRYAPSNAGACFDAALPRRRGASAVFLVSDGEKGMLDRQMTNRNEQPKESGIDQTQNRRTNNR
jgi:hypothetical protein